MLAAERHGKGRWPDQETESDIEDAVTSVVFGLLRYLPSRRGTGLLLNRLFPDEPQRDNLTVEFWPGDTTQPDVVITGDNIVALFEVKLDAPFGTQQLGREWIWLQDRCRTIVSTSADASSVNKASSKLVIVTRHARAADELRKQVIADLSALESDVAPPSTNDIRALTWHHLSDLILTRAHGDDLPHIAAILDDLDFYMRTRGLRTPPFEAWPKTGGNIAECIAWYAQAYFGSPALRVPTAPLWALTPKFYEEPIQ